MSWLDRVTGRTDEKMAGIAMERARDAAWKCALEYSYTSPEERANYLANRDQKVAHFGYKVVHSKSKVVRAIMVVINMLETGSAKHIIEILNRSDDRPN